VAPGGPRPPRGGRPGGAASPGGTAGSPGGIAGVEGAGERDGASWDPEPGSDSTVTEEVGDLGGTGIEGDAGFCLVALLFAGVDGREEDAAEDAFAVRPLASLVFQDVGSASGISGVDGVAGRGRVPLSPRRAERAAAVPIPPGVKLELLFDDVVTGGRSWDGLAHEAERGNRAMRCESDIALSEIIGIPDESSAFLPRTMCFLVTSVSLMVCCLSYSHQLVAKKRRCQNVYKVVRSSFVKQSFSSPHSCRFMQL
jgi:hypothetical protein